MASKKILESKEAIINEIADKIKNSESVILFSYQGLTVADMTELRTALRNANGNYRSYGEYIAIDHHDGTITLYA